MRVAVLADILGNLPELDAVLDDVAAAGVDAIVLNGDLVTGPMPAETLDRLAGLGERAVWVRGNADREVVASYDGMPYGGTGAYWALLGPDVVLRHSAYDTVAAAETFRRAAADYPGLPEFIAENVLTCRPTPLPWRLSPGEAARA